MSKSKNRVLCKSWDCLTKTCSRHRTHQTKRMSKPVDWIDGPADGCVLYKGLKAWKTIVKTEEELQTEWEASQKEDTEG